MLGSCLMSSKLKTLHSYNRYKEVKLSLHEGFEGLCSWRMRLWLKGISKVDTQVRYCTCAVWKTLPVVSSYTRLRTTCMSTFQQNPGITHTTDTLSSSYHPYMSPGCSGAQRFKKFPYATLGRLACWLAVLNSDKLFSAQVRLMAEILRLSVH